MLACFPLFFSFNPPWARLIIALYALAANLPCILARRYNRRIAKRLLARHPPSQLKRRS
jgi:glycosyl-4,4'-diaponeurosporenoate acyltransferase